MSPAAIATLERRLAGYDPDGLTAQVINKLIRPTTEPSSRVGEDTVLDHLRAMAPVRPLSGREAAALAERQAQRLRSELGVISPRFDDSAISRQNWLSIKLKPNFPTSGMATKTARGWVVVIRSDEAKVRQRFTLAHEIKHVIDDEAVAALAANDRVLYTPASGYTPAEQAERIADRFAAALLMPRPLLRADWADGLQDIASLSRRYGVSRQAMTVRLTQLGLLEPTRRCPPPTRHGDAA